MIGFINGLILLRVPISSHMMRFLGAESVFDGFLLIGGSLKTHDECVRMKLEVEYHIEIDTNGHSLLLKFYV